MSDPPKQEGFSLWTHKVPLPEALEEKQRQVDYWGHRAEKAEAEIERLRGTLETILQEGDVEVIWKIARRARERP